MTLREIVALYGEDVLDMELSFRVFDGHLNNSYAQPLGGYHTMFIRRGVDDHPGYARFEVGLDTHRLVKERV